MKKNYQAPESKKVELLPIITMGTTVGSVVSGTEYNPIHTE